MIKETLAILFIYGSHVLLFLIFVAFWLYPPKNRNSWYGYRTGQAFESQRNWDVAQVYSGKLGAISFGIITLITGIALLIFKHTEILFILLTMMIVFPAIIIIFLTERKLSSLPKEEVEKVNEIKANKI